MHGALCVYLLIKLAARLNCQVPTLYYYYKNKTAIIEELIEEGFGMLNEQDKIIAAKSLTPLEKIEVFFIIILIA